MYLFIKEEKCLMNLKDQVEIKPLLGKQIVITPSNKTLNFASAEICDSVMDAMASAIANEHAVLEVSRSGATFISKTPAVVLDVTQSTVFNEKVRNEYEDREKEMADMLNPESLHNQEQKDETQVHAAEDQEQKPVATKPKKVTPKSKTQ